MRTARVPATAGYFTLFVLVSFLSYAAHELVHHGVARLTCGAWGTMTFSTFQLAEGCAPSGMPLLATLAGPLLTYALMYAGVVLIARGRPLAGLTLALANLPLARFVTVLMRGGDEMVLGRAWIGGDAAWPVLMAVTVALLATPLVMSWRAIANRRRAAWFAGLLIVPLFIDMLVKRVVLARALEAWPAAVAGVPLLFVLTVAIAGFALWGVVRASRTRARLADASGAAAPA